MYSDCDIHITDKILKKAWRKHKEEIKANETIEQKRQRRILKKEYKQRNRQIKTKGNVAHSLSQPFVWHKKLEKEGKLHLSRKQLEKEQSEKMTHIAKELEEYKMAKATRNRQYTERTNTFEQIQREKDSIYNVEWEKSDERFQLEQATLKMKSRLSNGRANPIDFLWNYITTVGTGGKTSLDHPCDYFRGCSNNELDDLLYDIEVVTALEGWNNSDFWNAVTVLIRDQFEGVRVDDARMDGGVSEETMERVGSVIDGKTEECLRTLERHVVEKLKGGEGVDIGFWEILSRRLKVAIARAYLDEKHESLPNNEMQVAEEESDEEMDEENKAAREEYQRGGFSPVLMAFNDFGDVALEEDEDALRIDAARVQVIKMAEMLMDREQEFDLIAREGMNADESVLDAQIDLGKQDILWLDKYRPRKPRFFNRILMGFEWNRYNQTHYDPDNPPPKVVQGYKFNIYYPDLIDKSKPPTFTLTTCEEEDSFILKFLGGPPYEDIAFKIVDRDWELSWKYGYKCQFQNDIFQLWFNLRKERYRR